MTGGEDEDRSKDFAKSLMVVSTEKLLFSPVLFVRPSSGYVTCQRTDTNQLLEAVSCLMSVAG